MTEEITYDYLWQAYQKEKQTNQILLLPKTFYEDTMAFINKSTQENPDGIPSKENSIKLLSEFFEKRKQKILIYAAYGKQLPQPISNNETDFYNKIIQTVKSEKLDMNKKEHKTLLKSIRDIPEIILPSGNKIGPLKTDQIIDTKDAQDIEYLVNNSICELK